MSEAYLTASELYELDKVSDSGLAEHLKKLPFEKRELASHVYSKNRALRVMDVRVSNKDAGIKRLIGILEKNGINHV